MTNGVSTRAWYSPVGALMALFIAEKQACGYGYVAERALLRRFDRFLAAQGLRAPALPRDLVEQWVAKRPQESPGTQRLRCGLTRHFATFLLQHGYPAYVPDAHRMPKRQSSFVPYIFTHDEVGRLLQAADALPFRTSSPLRTHSVPALFRLLYSCGLRVSEALHLLTGRRCRSGGGRPHYSSEQVPQGPSGAADSGAHPASAAVCRRSGPPTGRGGVFSCPARRRLLSEPV